MRNFSRLDQLVSKIKNKFRRTVNCLLEYTEDYYTCYYPGNSGFFTRKLIRLLTSKLTVSPDQIDKLSHFKEDDIIIYASKYKTFYSFLFSHTRLKELGLFYPAIGFDFRFLFTLPAKRLIQMAVTHMDYFFRHFKFKDAYTSGYITRELLNGKSGFISLIEEQDFYKRFILAIPDPLSVLITLQTKTHQTIYLVPQDIIFIPKPERKVSGLLDAIFGTNDRPGKIKRLYAILKKPEKIAVEFVNPVNLKEFLLRSDVKNLDTEFQTHRLRSHLVDLINRQRKSITGPTLISRQEITEDILTEKSLKEYLADYSARENIPLTKVHKKAARYIQEIAANYNLAVINAMSFLLTWVFKNIFEGFVVDQKEISRMREKSKEAPLILVPCHKSHLDYLLLPYIMYRNNMPCPHIAAGKNLSFWPLGPIFRRGGAFFLRRTFKGAELYSKIFAAYLSKLLFEGFNIKIFIEGGRSRTGKTLPPRLGGLSMIIRAYRTKVCDNLYFVPIYIGYDRVLEEDAYIKEIEGGNKTSENLSGLVKARKFLKKKYGKVYIKFNEPISLNQYQAEKNIDFERTTDEEYMGFVKSLGYKLINAINKSVVVTPHGIVASAILNCSRNSFSKRQIMRRVTVYMNLLEFVNAELADTLVLDPETALDTVIGIFISRNFIELADEDEGEINEHTNFIVKGNKRAILDYYKNNVISYFVFPAYTAMAILEIDRFQFTALDLSLRFRFLKKLFMDEFPTDENTSCDQYIADTLKVFINEGIIVPDMTCADAFQLTSEGLRKLKWFAAFLLPFLESYKTTLVYFEKQPKGKNNDEKEVIKKIHTVGQKLYKKKAILLKESLSHINYRNAYRYYIKNDVQGSEDHYNIEFYGRIIDRLILLPIN